MPSVVRVVGIVAGQYMLGTAAFGFFAGGLHGYKNRHNAKFNEKPISSVLVPIAGACAGSVFFPYMSLVLVTHPVSVYRFFAQQQTFSHWGVEFKHHAPKK